MEINNDLLGKLVVIKFLDHAAFSKELCMCQTVGWVVSFNDKSITLAWWDLLNPEDQETLEINREYCTIITSAIDTIRLIND